MTLLERLRHLRAHASWADRRLLEALRTAARDVSAALREHAHVVATEEVWLARLEQRPSRVPVWPDLPVERLQGLLDQTSAAYDAYLARLRDADLDAAVAYTNTAGQAFTSTIGDILLHVALHGQYHRGKVNLLLRQAGVAPAPADFIAFVRGAPAATQAADRPEAKRD